MATLRVPVTARDHSRGSDDAPVTLVEYGDYECPYCAAAHPVVSQLEAHYGEQLRFVFRHFPLSQAHPHAESAAEMAELAGVHGRFWRMHDALYDNQDALGTALYVALAEALDIGSQEVIAALEKGAYAGKVRSDFIGGVRSGVNGTPAFFINDRRHDGSGDFAGLVRGIDAELEALGSKGASD